MVDPHRDGAPMSGLPILSDATLSLDDGVALLRFDRNDVRNALTGTALVSDIVATCAWANRTRDVACLILTGEGASFSAGGNVYDMVNREGMFGGSPMDIQQSYRDGIQRMTMAMYDIEVPTIAAINGAAVGAGLDLATMCDIRFASERAKFGETFVNLGIVPGDGGAWFLPRVVGLQRAAELTFSGRLFSASEALDMGLILDICADDDLLPRCETMARDFATKPRDALRLAKRLLRSSQRVGLADFLDHCASLQSLCHTTPEHEAALRAMVAQLRR